MFDVSKWAGLSPDVYLNLALVLRVELQRHGGRVYRADCTLAPGGKLVHLYHDDAVRLEQQLRLASVPAQQRERPLQRPDVCEGPLPQEETADLHGPRYAEEVSTDGPDYYGHG